MTNKTVSFDKPSGDDTVSLEVSDTVDENGDRVWRKAERYYVVSEGELETLIISTADTVRASCNDEWRKLEKYEQLADEAEAACRARPVESIGGGMWQDENYTGEHK